MEYTKINESKYIMKATHALIEYITARKSFKA